MTDIIIFSVIGLLLVLPLVFRDKISKNVYSLIAVSVCTYLCSFFKVVRPAESFGQFGLALVVLMASVIIYSNGYFLFRGRKQQIKGA